MNCFQLITSNPHKLAEYERYAAELQAPFSLRALPLDIPELQSVDPDEVLRAKAVYAKERTALPFMLDDTVFLTARYPNFPGTYAKFINATLGLAGWKRLFEEGDEIRAVTRIVLSYAGHEMYFEGAIDGIISFRGQTEAHPSALINAIFFVPSAQAFLSELILRETFENQRKRAFKSVIACVQSMANAEQTALDAMHERWDSRAESWPVMLQDQTAYVNYQDGYQRFSALVSELLPDVRGRALDIGCGTGEVSRQLARNDALAVTGIDLSARMIAGAEREPKANLRFMQAEVNQFASSEPFQLIVSRGIVLSHLPASASLDFLIQLTNLAANGAYCVFDFLKNQAQGDFTPAHNLQTFSLDDLLRWMAELGWVPVAIDAPNGARVGIVAFYKDDGRSVYIASGSRQKARELLAAVGPSGGAFVPAEIDVDEIKSNDIEYIVEAKLKQAYAVLRRPVICTDGGIFIDALKGFPGPNSKQAVRTLGADGLLSLLAGCKDRTARRRNAIGYYDGSRLRTQMAEVVCKVSEGPRGELSGYPLDRILVPTCDGNPEQKTYAELPLEKRVLMTELPQFVKFLQGVGSWMETSSS